METSKGEISYGFDEKEFHTLIKYKPQAVFHSIWIYDEMSKQIQNKNMII